MKTDARRIIEIVGIFGVIASLVFVGFQLRQEQRIAIGDQYQNRTESRKADIRATLESDAWMARMSKEWELGERPTWWNNEFESSAEQSGYNGADVWGQIYQIRLGILQIDNNFYQADQNLLPDGFRESNREFLKNYIRDPFVREVALDFGGGLSSILPELIIGIENEI